MRYPIRRIYGDGKLIGAFVSFNGKIEPMLLGEYFYETPRINPWPELISLESASRLSLAEEVRSRHPSISISDSEFTPDLTIDDGDLRGAWIAIKIWLRGEA